MSEFLAILAVWIIKLITAIYDVVTIPIYVILQCPMARYIWLKKKKTAEVDVGYSLNKHYGSRMPHKEISDFLLKRQINTVDQVISWATNHYRKRKCLGTRKLLEEEIEYNGETQSVKKVFGMYYWRTYEDLKIEIGELSRGLNELGLKEREPVAIFSETRAEWLISAFACFQQNIPIATIYVTMHSDGITSAVNEVEPSTLITSIQQLPKLVPLLKGMSSLQKVIYFEEQIGEPDFSGFPEKILIFSYSQILKLGQSWNAVRAFPTAEDLAVIMFTSGTTGPPKGVMISHGNIMSTVRAFTDQLTIKPSDVLIGFLPLAHIFELTCEMVTLIVGASIGYSSSMTIVDSSPQIKPGTKGDATVLKPTIMVATPLLLDRINKAIDRKIEFMGSFKKNLMQYALSYKKFWYRMGFSTPIMNRLLFGKVRQVLGGRIRLVVCGGAPLSPLTQRQIALKFCVNVVQGYGLTETTSCGTAQLEKDLTVGRIGYPITEALIRLDDEGYEGRSDGKVIGELILGGDFVTQGYYKHESSEGFFEDYGIRWFRTGDVAVLHKDGSFEIVDRKKDIIKLQHGEYISLGRIEMELKSSKYVEDICLHADPTKYFPVAIVVPSQDFIKEMAETFQLQNIPKSDLYSLLMMENAMVQTLHDYAKTCNLIKYEVPIRVKLVEDSWTPESGKLTAGFKLKRRVIYAEYKGLIDEMYRQLEEMDQVSSVIKF